MFKVLVLLSVIAAVYCIPAPQTPSAEVLAEGTPSKVNPEIDVSAKAVKGGIEPKNENEELEGAEFGWGWRSWGWGYPIYRSYYYPSYYHWYWW